MKKAKYLGKYVYKYTVRGVHPVDLFYEYRGREYIVTDMHNGIDDLAAQHAAEQARIDRLIEKEAKPDKEYRYEDSGDYGFDLFWQYVNSGDETIFD